MSNRDRPNTTVIDLGEQEAVLNSFVEQACNAAIKEANIPMLVKAYHAAVEAKGQRREPTIFIQYEGENQTLKMTDANVLTFLMQELKPYANMLGKTRVLALHESNTMETEELSVRYRENMLELERMANNTKIAFKSAIAICNDSIQKISSDVGGGELIDSPEEAAVLFSESSPVILPKNFREIIQEVYSGAGTSDDIEQVAVAALTDFTSVFAGKLQTLINEHEPLQSLISAPKTQNSII